MGELSDFCHGASQNLMEGLERELKLIPKRDYFPKGQNSLRVLSFRLQGISPSCLPDLVKMQNRLGFWAGLPDKYKARVGHDGYAIIIEIPKPGRLWQQVTFEELAQKGLIRHGLKMLIGLGLRDDPKRLNYGDPDTGHALVAGITRSGKTTLLHGLTWNFCQNVDVGTARLLIFDVAKKGNKWHRFENIDHLAYPLILDIQTAEAVLTWLVQEIKRRSEQRYSAPKIVVFIDELKALIDESVLCEQLLGRIAAIGAEFGIHLILATQYPQIKFIGSGELKKNTSIRLCGKVDDAAASANALGLPGEGAERLSGYGDFLFRKDDAVERITVPNIEPKTIEALPRGGGAGYITLPEPDYNEQQLPTLLGRRQPDPLLPEQVALALFKQQGINKLQTELGVGGTKAQRIKDFADAIRVWALENGYNCLQLKD